MHACTSSVCAPWRTARSCWLNKAFERRERRREETSGQRTYRRASEDDPRELVQLLLRESSEGGLQLRDGGGCYLLLWAVVLTRCSNQLCRGSIACESGEHARERERDVLLEGEAADRGAAAGRHAANTSALGWDLSARLQPPGMSQTPRLIRQRYTPANSSPRQDDCANHAALPSVVQGTLPANPLTNGVSQDLPVAVVIVYPPASLQETANGLQLLQVRSLLLAASGAVNGGAETGCLLHEI